jgi:hypothetical protein
VQSVSGRSSGGLITIHYCLIWNYWIPYPSPLTTRRKYSYPPPQGEQPDLYCMEPSQKLRRTQ